MLSQKKAFTRTRCAGWNRRATCSKPIIKAEAIISVRITAEDNLKKTQKVISVNNMQKAAIKSIGSGIGAALVLLSIYFFILTLISGRGFAQSQFAAYWYFIISLAVGFGIQIALYRYIRNLVHNGQGMGKVVGVSGTTSTASMISCCAHYLVNIAPILGVTGLVTFVAQYQVGIFWVGIAFNLFGIWFIGNKIVAFKKHHE